MSLMNFSSFVILGIVVLCCALLFVYFENKAREQNHKISSMLSLVSSLTEEVHSVRRQMQGGGIRRMDVKMHDLVVDESNYNDDDDESNDDESNDDESNDLDDDLISVSDEDEDEDEDLEDESDEENQVIEIGDTVKILTLMQPIELVSDEDNIDADDDESLAESLAESLPESLAESLDDQKQIFDLKSIHLEEPASVDYKKLSVGKLKTIVAEKGLVADPAKLKKQELLKLLNAE